MPILDAQGRPVNTGRLTEEIAGASIASIRNVFAADSIARGLTPARLGSILQQVDEGTDPRDYLILAEEMEERDPNYRSKLSVRKMAVQGLPLVVTAANPDDPRSVEQQEFVQDILDQPIFIDSLLDSLDALGKGYSVVEIIWQRDATQWTPLQYKWRDPRFFRFDRDNGEEILLLTEDSPAIGESLEPCKFITHRPKMKSGLTIRGGLARIVAAMHLYKSFALKDWMVFAEVYGIPLRLGKYDTEAHNEKDIATLRTAVANLGTDAAAVMPRSMELELVQAAKVGDGKGLFEALTNWLDKQTTLAILGTNATSEEGGSFAKATALEEVRGDILKSDTRQLNATINRDLVKPLIDLNFGPPPDGVYPTAALTIEEPEDLVGFTQALLPWVKEGLRIEAAAVRDKFGLQEPDEDAEILGESKPEPAQPPPLPPGLDPEPEPEANPFE
jgi:phage gp29-like protein